MYGGNTNEIFSAIWAIFHKFGITGLPLKICVKNREIETKNCENKETIEKKSFEIEKISIIE